MHGPETARHSLVDAALVCPPEAVVQTTLGLWERLAPELTAIVGEAGLQSIYLRSVRLTCARHPWVAQAGVARPGAQRFAELAQCLQAQPPARAAQGSRELLHTFLDVLARLVGEAVTARLLRSAWGPEPFETRAP